MKGQNSPEFRGQNSGDSLLNSLSVSAREISKLSPELSPLRNSRGGDKGSDPFSPPWRALAFEPKVRLFFFMAARIK